MSRNDHSLFLNYQNVRGIRTKLHKLYTGIAAAKFI